MSDTIAFFYGVVIVVAFSYERFNRISFETGRRLERLVTFLTPDKLRARRQVTFAYFVYTSSLIATYAVLCAYGNVLLPLIDPAGVLPTLGATGLPMAENVSRVSEEAMPITTGFAPIPGESGIVDYWVGTLAPGDQPVRLAPDNDNGFGIPAEVSMGLALVLVGLAPSVAPLIRADEWLRNTAHRMAGIPTWAVDAADALRSSATELKIFNRPGVRDTGDAERGGFLVSKSDYVLVDEMRAAAGQELGNLEDFALSVELILVSSAWFLDESLLLPTKVEKQRFKDIEDNLKTRKATFRENLQRALDGKGDRAAWEALAVEAEELASDFCILIAMYDQHGVISRHEGASGHSRDQQEARKRLSRFVEVLYSNQHEPIIRRRASNLALFWTLGLAMGWAMIWAVSPMGAAEYELQFGLPAGDSSSYKRLAIKLTVAFNAYCVAIIAAISLRWLRRKNQPEDGLRRWENMRYPSHWTRWLPQAALVVAVAWGFSMLVTLAVMMWNSGLTADGGWQEIRFWQTLLSIFEYNAPISIRGAVLALMVVILLDARQRLWLGASEYHRVVASMKDGDDEPLVGLDEGTFKSLKDSHATWTSLSMTNSLIWSVIGAGSMAAVALVTRYLSYYAAARRHLVQGDVRPFDDIDLGLMIWAALYCAILGGLVLFSISEALSGRALGASHSHHGQKSQTDQQTAGVGA